MTDIEFKCPLCGSVYEAEKDWIGQIADCPSCGKEITIQPVKKIQLLKLEPKTANPETKNTQELDTKKCPFCAETIKRKAVKCRFCGAFLKDNHHLQTANNHDENSKTDAETPVVESTIWLWTIIGFLLGSWLIGSFTRGLIQGLGLSIGFMGNIFLYVMGGIILGFLAYRSSEKRYGGPPKWLWRSKKKTNTVLTPTIILSVLILFFILAFRSILFGG